MPLILPTLQTSLVGIFSVSNNQPTKASNDFALAIETYFLQAIVLPDGIPIGAGIVSNIIKPIVTSVFSNSNNPSNMAALQISTAITNAALAMQFVGTCFGVGKIIQFNTALLTQELTTAFSSQYNDPNIPALKVANAIHNVYSTCIVLGSGAAPPLFPCVGAKQGSPI